jgi:hypothetical protein
MAGVPGVSGPLKICRPNWRDSFRHPGSPSLINETPSEVKYMPKYQVYFDTINGETRYNVDIDEHETMEEVIHEILSELRERGQVLQGDGDLQVVWNGQSLDFGAPLSNQGVRPNDLLRVSTIARNG